jgi:CobQ-like glutamine amidotransferase family enzyme
MTTSWQILDTKYQTADGLVTKVTYGCTAQIDNLIDRTIGHLELTGDPTSEDYIPYENLTEQTVIGWVQATLGAQTVADIETSLQNSVTAKKAAKDAETTKNGLPWR